MQIILISLKKYADFRIKKLVMILEYDAISRLGISDPVAFVKRNYSGLLDLPTCAVGPQLLEQVEAAVEEAYASNSFVDLMVRLDLIIKCVHLY